jgi:pimeloyl-ACP methyl ester carboxylesterase
MHAAIVVVHEVKRNLVRVVFKLLAESVCETGKLPPIPLSDLSKIKAPTLLLTGDEDVVFPSPVAEKLARYLPNARLHCFRKTGHSAFFERAAEYNAVLAQFLRSVNASGSRQFGLHIDGAG